MSSQTSDAPIDCASGTPIDCASGTSTDPIQDSSELLDWPYTGPPLDGPPPTASHTPPTSKSHSSPVPKGQKGRDQHLSAGTPVQRLRFPNSDPLSEINFYNALKTAPTECKTPSFCKHVVKISILTALKVTTKLSFFDMLSPDAQAFALNKYPTTGDKGPASKFMIDLYALFLLLSNFDSFPNTHDCCSSNNAWNHLALCHGVFPFIDAQKGRLNLKILRPCSGSSAEALRFDGGISSIKTYKFKGSSNLDKIQSLFFGHPLDLLKIPQLPEGVSSLLAGSIDLSRSEHEDEQLSSPRQAGVAGKATLLYLEEFFYKTLPKPPTTESSEAPLPVPIRQIVVRTADPAILYSKAGYPGAPCAPPMSEESSAPPSVTPTCSSSSCDDRFDELKNFVGVSLSGNIGMYIMSDELAKVLAKVLGDCAIMAAPKRS